MELAANTVVILIVSMVILALATTLTYRVVCSAEDFSSRLDAQSSGQTDRLLSGSGDVVVGDNEKTAKIEGSMICGSGRTRVAEFTLGIRNSGSGEGTFSVDVQPSGAPLAPADTAIFFDDSITLQPGETHAMVILITDASGLEGQYTYDVKVTRGVAETYGVQRLYVTFP